MKNIKNHTFSNFNSQFSINIDYQEYNSKSVKKMTRKRQGNDKEMQGNVKEMQGNGKEM